MLTDEQYQLARERFEDYAGMDAPQLPADPWAARQVELARWQARNFGTPSDADITLGIVEEIGEWIETSTGSVEEIDAIGDVLIYCCQLATSNRLDFRTLIEATKARPDITIHVGRLAHAVLKTHQGIRGFDDRDFSRRRIANALTGIAASFNADCDTRGAFFSISAEVLKRDWTANKLTGAK